jgi:hypothetical protein
MAKRTEAATLSRQAVEDLARALRSYDLNVEVPTSELSDSGVDLVVRDPNGQMMVAIEVKAASTLTPDRAAAFGRQSKGVDEVAVVVADQISDEAKRRLRKAGWGYYDRRGELVVRSPSLIIETNRPPKPRFTHNRSERSPLESATGLTLACAMLLSPDTPIVLRDLERRSGLDNGNLSRAAKALRDQALVRPNGTPLVPELFWAVADHWKPHRIPVGRRPPVADARLGGPMAALAWGAAVVATTDYPPDLYVAEAGALEQLSAATPPPAPGAEVATLAVAPTPLLWKEPSERSVDGYLLVQPLFAALDLATDRARGVELLDDFAPEGAARVW